MTRTDHAPAVVELIDFAAASRVADKGFGQLDDRGRVEPTAPVLALTTARMTFSFAIGALLDLPGSRELAAHGVASLAGPLTDPAHGGVMTLLGDPDAPKSAYHAAFVALASSTAVVAGIEGADALLAEAAGILESRFWVQSEGALRESWDRTFTREESYRGANANMHGVEAMLSIFAATGETVWRDRALRAADLIINRNARAHDWRVPEHYDEQWRVLPDYNRENPADGFRPFGATIGHWFEWSRLLLELESTYTDPPEWLRPAAIGLFEAAAREGWNVDGADGFVYTVDWQGVPVVRQRLHWVAAEAIAAAGTLATVTGAERYTEALAEWRDYADRRLIDHEHGSWHHELDELNRPAATIWPGKPDAYHVLHALLIPELPVAASLAARIRAAS